MHVLALIAVACCVAAPAARGQTNNFGLSPDTTCATARGGLASAAGDVLTLVDGQDLRGVGQWGRDTGRTVGRVNGFAVTVQDQNGSTTESFTFAVLPEDPTVPGSPDTNPANELLRTAPVSTPPGVGIVAWLMTINLGTPADVLPQTSTFFYGAGLNAAPSWSNDGMSLHMASYPPQFGCGDNPRVGGPRPAPNVAFAVTRPAGAVMQPSARTHELFVATEAAVLNSGQDVAAGFRTGPNPAFGVGGLYPDTQTTPGRRDGLALRYRATVPGAVTIMVSSGWGPSVALVFAQGDYLLDPTTQLALAPRAFTGGETVFALTGPGTLPLGLDMRLHWQAASLSPTNRVLFSNGTVTDLR